MAKKSNNNLIYLALAAAGVYLYTRPAAAPTPTPGGGTRSAPVPSIVIPNPIAVPYGGTIQLAPGNGVTRVSGMGYRPFPLFNDGSAIR